MFLFQFTHILNFSATKHLGDIKSDSESTSDLAPLVEFFELVHIADLIQQMVQVYYDEEMVIISFFCAVMQHIFVSLYVF
jgi:hypothetical protein